MIVRHVAGNLRSRFRDFLTTDGEKPDRDRDNEFEMPEALSRAELLKEWDAAWTIVLASIEALTPEDLDRTIYIRREGLLVVEALNRSVTHTAYHVGQIVYLARHLAWPTWQSLSIPKGQSANVGTGTFKTTGLTRRHARDVTLAGAGAAADRATRPVVLRRAPRSAVSAVLCRCRPRRWTGTS